MSADFSDLISLHLDAIDGRRFKSVHYNGSGWTLSHLDPFAFRAVIASDLVVDVVVIFSCHCFTHDRADDKRFNIAPSELYADQWESRPRVLNPERYRLSRLFLPVMIRDLPKRRIRVEGERKNYFTLEATDSKGKPVFYLAYFEVKKDAVRKKRLILRVQTAFPVEALYPMSRYLDKHRHWMLLARAKRCCSGRVTAKWRPAAQSMRSYPHA